MNHHSWKRIAIEVLIIFLLSLTPLLWFRSGMLMVGHDLVTPLEPKTFLEGRLSTWNNQFFGRSQVLILGTIPIHLIDAIPSLLGFSLQATQKIVYIFWFFLIGLAAYVLAHVLKPRSSLFKFIIVLFYQFNFFILQGWWIAEKSKFSAYIATPLIIATFFLVRSETLSVLAGAVLNSFILFFLNAGGLYGMPLYGGLFIALACFLIFFTITNVYVKNFHAIRRMLLLTAMTGILALLMNAYFVFPAFMKLRTQLTTNIAQAGGISGIISWASVISANTSFLNLMRLQGIAEWYDNPQHPYAKIFLSNPILIVVSFLWPLMIFASLYVVRERTRAQFVLYFFFVYLLGLFFSAGTHPPLGFFYQFLVEKIPGFIVFRSPYFKFAPSLFLSSAVLIAFFLDSFSLRVRKIASILFLGVIVVYHFPFFTGNFFEWRSGYSTRLWVPAYVFDFGKWLRAQPSSSRILMVPPNSPDLDYSLYTWGYLSFQALPTLLSNNSVVINNDQLNTEERHLVMALYDAIATADKSKIERLISLLRISHIVVTSDTNTNILSSIPLELERYIKGIASTGLFEKEREFGQWHVWRVRQSVQELLFAVNRLPVIDSVQEDSALYMSHPVVNGPFILRSDRPADPHDSTIAVVPQCVNCFKKSKAAVIFPERNILPGDPFYGLVLLSERLRKAPVDPKSAIYNALGISLKRMSEVNEMLFAQRELTKDIVDRYLDLLTSIEKNFEHVSSPQDKLEVAGDIAYYLRSERNFLRPNLGKYLTGGPQTVLIGTIFTAIHRTENVLESFVAPLNNPTSRLYYFSLDTPGTFEILLRASDVRELKESKTPMRITVDESAVSEIPTDRIAGEWVSLGVRSVERGFHTLTLTLPEDIQTSYALQPVETEFTARQENTCFGSNVAPIASGKLYKTILRYRNDFSDDLIFFAWEKEWDKERLLAAVRLPVSPFEEKTEEIFDVSPQADTMTIAVCAPNLTNEKAEKQFHLAVGEAVYPSILLTSMRVEPIIFRPVPYQTKSTTRYELELPKSTMYPTTVVFSERFDPWWELRGTQAQHIKVNGYANAWTIERPPTEPLVLSYKGERFFRWGAVISFVTITAGMVIFMRNWRRKKL